MFKYLFFMSCLLLVVDAHSNSSCDKLIECWETEPFKAIPHLYEFILFITAPGNWKTFCGKAIQIHKCTKQNINSCGNFTLKTKGYLMYTTSMWVCNKDFGKVDLKKLSGLECFADGFETKFEPKEKECLDDFNREVEILRDSNSTVEEYCGSMDEYVKCLVDGWKEICGGLESIIFEANFAASWFYINEHECNMRPKPMDFTFYSFRNG